MKKITWGASRENTLWIPYFENANAWSKPAPNWEWIRAGNGYRDSWEGDWDFMAAGDVPWIPKSATTSPVFSSGWDGALGWDAFLRWAAVHPNWFGWHNDARNLYPYPTLVGDTNGDGIANGHVAFRSSTSTSYASHPYGQWVGAVFTAVNQVAGIEATTLIPAWPGMPVRYYSMEAQVARAVGATTGSLTLAFRRDFRDASNAVLGSATYITVATDPNNPSDWLRFTGPDTAVPPAGTAWLTIRPCLRSMIDASATGSAIAMRNVQVELGSFTTFADGDVYTPSQLILMPGEPPQLMNDGSRGIRLEMASTNGQPFAGFTYG